MHRVSNQHGLSKQQRQIFLSYLYHRKANLQQIQIMFLRQTNKFHMRTSFSCKLQKYNMYFKYFANIQLESSVICPYQKKFHVNATENPFQQVLKVPSYSPAKYGKHTRIDQKRHSMYKIIFIFSTSKFICEAINGITGATVFNQN
uniref:Uncharacterized protein n=1 Tax=Spironucleus salmonicida TaxID=348837 RepID=V6LTZ4_9EUKA|eukprot:EST48137.1 Hypothetical protein SS50377_11716 [Spironucleus salmonicida]